ncbi:MAG: LLM class flavin-dependent oxidoreductase, partial [Chloroflexi bacterium]|nr:LLM class flavin-dependent oxidoreductase [Chloroflexota bacterium]
LCRRFVELSRKAGHNVAMSQIPFFRYFYVAATEAEARKDSQDALNWTLDMTQWRRTFTVGSEVNLRLQDWRDTRSELPPSYDYLCEHRAIIGTPDQCVAKIKELQRQGIEYFGCNFSFGGLEHEKLLRSMELFSKEVMPHFK